MVSIGSGAQRELQDLKLSRYACYLVVQNGDPSKPVIAAGQTYFAIQTRRQELASDGSFQQRLAGKSGKPLLSWGAQCLRISRSRKAASNKLNPQRRDLETHLRMSDLNMRKSGPHCSRLKG